MTQQTAQSWIEVGPQTADKNFIKIANVTVNTATVLGLWEGHSSHTFVGEER